MTNKLTASDWGLNEQQFRFAHEYVGDLNAKQAAARAGYSEHTAQNQGSRLLAHVQVVTLIAHLLDERTKRTMINSDWLLTRLASAVTADIADIYEDDGQLKPVHQWPEVWRTGLVAGLDVEPAVTIDGVKMCVTKVKLTDRTKLLEMIGKHVDVQAFKDRVAIENDLTPWGSVVAAEHVRGGGA